MTTAREPSAREDAPRLALFCVVGLVLANAAFYFLSGNYFASHHQIVSGARVATYSAEQESHIRIVFGAISTAIAAATFASGVSRHVFRHVLAALLGLCNLVAGGAALWHGLSGALTATLLISGVLMPVLAWFSYHGVRGAWTFLVTMCGVFAVATLFGAPKIRAGLDVGLWTTMVLPGMFAVACVSLAMLHRDYVDRTPASSTVA